MSHANATVDYESAALDARGLPAADITPVSFKHEKDMIVAPPLEDVTVSAAHQNQDGDIEPTDEEYHTLRKVPAAMKWTAIAMCMIELAERASYYGTTGVVQNFIRGKLPVGGNGAGAVAPGEAGVNQSAGALGKGSVTASGVYSAFVFLAYITPIVGGIVADTKWGRFKTLCWGTGFGAVVHVLLVIPAIPSVIASGHAFPPFVIFFFLLSFAAGFIKPCLGPLLCDQSPVKRPIIQTTKKGERVILDPQATVQRYLLIFYWCINVGGFFAVATSYSERFVGFWLAYLEPGIIYMLCPIVLVVCYKRLYRAPAQGSVVMESIKVLKTIFANGGIKKMFKGGDEFWNAAKPSYILERDGTVDRTKIFWDDEFVDEIRQSIVACGVFSLIPIFNLADGGVGNQMNDMSVAMTLNNIPNDVINNFNPLIIIGATPIITFGLYPFFEKIGYPIKPMTRMCIGFLLGMATMIASALIQWRIYATSPCGWYATDCDDVSPVNLLWQILLYTLPALGEIFINVTSYELAYTRAPARMKGLVYALCLANQAISSAISLACSAAITDPYLIWPYVAVGAACLVCAIICPTYFRHLNEATRSFADPERQAGKQQPNFKAQEAQQEVTEDVDEKY